MSIEYDPYDHNVLVVGSAGSGKTFFVNNHIIKGFLIASNTSFVIYDYNWRGYDDLLIPKSHHFEKHFQYIFQPIDKKMSAFIEFCRHHKELNRVMVVEEVQEYGNTNSMPEIFEDRVRTGRNEGRTTVSITQRPQEIHKAIVSNAEFIFVFRLGWINDVKVVASWIGADPFELKNMPKYHYYQKYKYSDKPSLMKPVKAS